METRQHRALAKSIEGMKTDMLLYLWPPYRALIIGSCLDIMKTAYPDGFDEISIATILKQALQGLDYLHKNGHIHRQVASTREHYLLSNINKNKTDVVD